MIPVDRKEIQDLVKWKPVLILNGTLYKQVFISHISSSLCNITSNHGKCLPPKIWNMIFRFYAEEQLSTFYRRHDHFFVQPSRLQTNVDGSRNLVCRRMQHNRPFGKLRNDDEVVAAEFFLAKPGSTLLPHPNPFGNPKDREYGQIIKIPVHLLSSRVKFLHVGIKVPDVIMHIEDSACELCCSTSRLKCSAQTAKKVDLSILDHPWKEFKATTSTFLKKEFLLLILWIGQGVYSESVFFTYIALWFSVRARALGSFISGIVAVLAGNLLGVWLDQNQIALKKRARWAYAVIMTLQGGWWIWLTVNVTKFRRQGPIYDWSDPGFGSAFGVFIFLVTGFQLNYNFAFFIIGQISNSPQETVRLSALLRGTESAWQALSYGLNALPIFATVGSTYLNLGLWGVSLFPAWLVIRQLGTREKQVSGVEERVMADTKA
ncbi:hypothetical protein F66182_3496 [Fusarium sp. NRRL 66182]|nr:hypothetical protein F66182_3496 [Fusarium sp. NRRL 66182]